MMENKCTQYDEAVSKFINILDEFQREDEEVCKELAENVFDYMSPAIKKLSQSHIMDKTKLYHIPILLKCIGLEEYINITLSAYNYKYMHSNKIEISGGLDGSSQLKYMIDRVNMEIENILKNYADSNSKIYARIFSIKNEIECIIETILKIRNLNPVMVEIESIDSFGEFIKTLEDSAGQLDKKIHELRDVYEKNIGNNSSTTDQFTNIRDEEAVSIISEIMEDFEFLFGYVTEELPMELNNADERKSTMEFLKKCSPEIVKAYDTLEVEYYLSFMKYNEGWGPLDIKKPVSFIHEIASVEPMRK